ncbi:hypothetical protein [Mycoplana rhizolycopersici]|uniref:Uncharacterized protein n=1 Tax=Mycoplana rhizolycopersici TaxID=2746702 RepID=A0ABX2QDZ6_9HYPH|nr:hypothetical protein [Rhizobium rhizolycopersici]NVP55955.1 hypothetical protein [Rhizobium rhizolycopersici]
MAVGGKQEMNDELELAVYSVPDALSYGQSRIIVAAIEALCANSENPARVKADILSALSALSAESFKNVGSSYGSMGSEVLRAATATAETLVAACDRAETRMAPVD